MPRKKLPKIKVRSRGLGDTVLKVTTATGIAYVTEIIASAFNVNCGCDERQEKLNRLFPYATYKEEE